MKKAVRIGFGLLCISLMLIPLIQLYESYQTLILHKGKHRLPEPKYRVVFIPPAVGDPYWEQVKDGISGVASAQEALLEVHGGYRFNVSEMVKAMRMAISSKVDGIIVMGVDHPDFIKAVNDATQKGIPVITVGIDAPQSLRKMYVGTDHIASGEALGKLIVQEMKRMGNVGILGRQQSTTMQALRLQGLRRSFQHVPRMQVFEQIYDQKVGQEALETMNQMNGMLNEHPNLQSVIVLNGDEVDSVLRVISERMTTSNIKIYTFDDVPQAADSYYSGEVQGLIAHDPKQIGSVSMKYLLTWIEGKRLPLPHHVYTDFQVWSKNGQVLTHEKNK